MASKSSDWRPGPTVCRCCFTEGCYKDISTEYFWMGKREVYSEMLHETFDVSIAYSVASGPNSNSRLICEPCISRLRDASDFKRQVKECEKTFMQHLDPGSTMELELQVETTDDKSVKLELVKEEQKLSDDEFDDRTGFQDDDDDDDDLDDEPLTTLASKIPKKESVDLSDLLDNAKAEKRKSTAKVKASPAKKPKKKEVPKPSASKAPAPKVEKKKKEPVWRNTERKMKPGCRDQRSNAEIILDCSNACPFRWKSGTFLCAYCHLEFGDFTELRNHSSTHLNKAEALRHVRKSDDIKIDISRLKCELCLKPFKNIDPLITHLMTEHKKPIKKEYGIGVISYFLNSNEFVCTYCNKKFERFNRLNNHINEHESKHVCYKCGKKFSAVYRLQTHMATHNEAGTKVIQCTKCKEIFASNTLKIKHLQEAHAISLYRCPQPRCRERFWKFSDRIKHLKQVHDRKVDYPCHLCPAVFMLNIRRAKHIRQVHVGIKQ